ncbi:MAG: SurA N-terminal domain-containing protein [Porticoccaceae bacterium]|nr:SurA N-terminal domain-containing protein [Porticoccaceae bacterium]
MLDSFRTNMRNLALGIVVVIGFIFAFSGTGTLFLTGNLTDTAAVVGEVEIPEIDVIRAINNQRSRIISENEGLDATLITDEMIRPSAIEQLISRQILVQSSDSQKLAIPQTSVTQEILNIEGFQVDGRFDQDSYRFMLQQQGYTSAGFKSTVANELLVQQLVAGITDTAFVTELELNAMVEITGEQRDYYYFTLPIGPITEETVVSDEQTQNYYSENITAYRSEAQVIIDYIELNPDELVNPDLVNSELVKARFDEERDTLDLSESRQAAHILLEDPSDELIREIQGKITSGEAFADLASQYSTDFGSADLGGDLGFTSGTTFPEAFELALKQLSLNEVSQPVTTDAGVHFIKLLDIQQQDFILADETARIERELMAEATTDQLVAKLELLKELSFNADSLANVAEDVGLTLKTSPAFSRSGGSGITADTKVNSAAFSSEVLTDGYASEVLDLGNDRYVVVKLNEYIEDRQKELMEVRESVVDSLTRELAQDELQRRGSELRALVQSGTPVEEVAKSNNLQWQVAKNVDRRDTSVNTDIRDRLFAMASPKANPVVEGFYTNSGDYVVAALTAVIPGDINDIGDLERASIADALLSRNGGRDLESYEKLVRSDTKIIQ